MKAEKIKIGKLYTCSFKKNSYFDPLKRIYAYLPKVEDEIVDVVSEIDVYMPIERKMFSEENGIEIVFMSKHGAVVLGSLNFLDFKEAI